MIDCFYSISAGHFLNTILPSKAGEILRPLYISKIYKISYLKLISSCVLERIIDIIVTLILVIIILIFNSQDILVVELDSLAYFTIIFLLLLIFGIIITKNIEKINNKLTHFLDSWKRVRKKNNRVLFVTTTLLFWLAGILATYFQLKSCPLPAQLHSIEAAIFITTLISFALILPSVPGNIGVLSVALNFLMLHYLRSKGVLATDIEKQQILNASVIIHFIILLCDFTVGLHSHFQLNRKIEVK